MRRRFALALVLPLVVIPAAAASASLHAGRAEPAVRRDSPPPALGLRLNEVDYDQPGYDTGEFVEIVNVSADRDRLRNVALVFVNGATSAEYRRVPLSGRLGPSRRLVVATGTVSVGGSARVLLLPLAKNNIQNGAPDGVALLDTADGTVIDALSYEGSIDQAQIDGVPEPVSLAEGQPVSERDSNEVAGSLCRLPVRTDTGD